jgi:ferredoxin--NADP+ reductase
VLQFKVAIVGAGPAGYFAAQALQNAADSSRSFHIDMIERLPTPWGLVRSGVAPDHQKIKTVSKVFEKIAADDHFRLFANVEVGSDLSITQLQERYDAVILATGSSLGKKLGILGEELRGSLSAAVFVPWYNAHPDFIDVDPPLDTDTAIVIGAGNVAVDVARMLAQEPSELDRTDTADYAINALKAGGIRRVYISARRGPEHAAFSSPELRELLRLERTAIVMQQSDFDAAMTRAGDGAVKDVKSNLDAMRLIVETPNGGHERTLEFLFHHTPRQIIGADRVEGVVFETPHGDVTIKCGLVISAIGYQAEGIDGVPYENGRVVSSDGRVQANLYVVGWAKRGPTGVIGTNKSDAAAVVELLVSDLQNPKNKGDLTELFTNQIAITQEDWQRINQAEVDAGEPLGKPREKMFRRDQMVAFSQSVNREIGSS